MGYRSLPVWPENAKKCFWSGIALAFLSLGCAPTDVLRSTPSPLLSPSLKDLNFFLAQSSVCSGFALGCYSVLNPEHLKHENDVCSVSDAGKLEKKFSKFFQQASNL